VEESIQGIGRKVQLAAAALMLMHPAERRPFIRPLVALIERVVDGDTDSILAANRAIAETPASNAAL
jgi:hypothetical protein